MTSIQTLRFAGLNAYMILPETGVWAESAVFMLHGYGADGRDMIGLAQEWAHKCPKTIFFAPDAPYPCEISPIGRQWFSLQDMDIDFMREDIKKNWEQANHFINAAMDEYNIPNYRAIIGGFSQGAMMALEIAFERDEACAGVLGYSGILLNQDNLNRHGHKNLPVHLIHGSLDPVVPSQAWDDAMEALKTQNINVTGYKSHDLAHGINLEGIESGLSFIREKLEY